MVDKKSPLSIFEKSKKAGNLRQVRSQKDFRLIDGSIAKDKTISRERK